MIIGFLGGGNMGSALMQGLVKSRPAGFDAVKAYDPTEAAQKRLADIGVALASSADELFADCDMIVLAVKPQVLEKAVAPYAGALSGKFVVSIAAGWTLEQLHKLLP